jgi:hypothetical protein
VFRAQGLFPNRQRPLVKGFGLRVLALVIVKRRQVVEALGHVGVLRAQGRFPDRQRPIVKRERYDGLATFGKPVRMEKVLGAPQTPV